MAEEQTAMDEQQQTETHVEEQRAEVDWKAEARKWEKRAKENKDAAEKLASMESDSASRISELEERAAKAEQEANDLRHMQDMAKWAEEAAKAHGVPASILRGTTAEEYMDHAAAIKASLGTAPVVRDSGKPHTPPKSSEAIFNEFMRQNFN